MDLDLDLYAQLTGSVLDRRDLAEGGLSIYDPRRRIDPESLMFRRLTYRQRVGPTPTCRGCGERTKRVDGLWCSRPACRSLRATLWQRSLEGEALDRYRARRRAWWARTHGRGLRMCSWGCGAPATPRSERCADCTKEYRRVQARARQARWRARRRG